LCFMRNNHGFLEIFLMGKVFRGPQSCGFAAFRSESLLFSQVHLLVFSGNNHVIRSLQTTDNVLKKLFNRYKISANNPLWLSCGKFFKPGHYRIFGGRTNQLILVISGHKTEKIFRTSIKSTDYEPKAKIRSSK
jgi:hypothetical protein